MSDELFPIEPSRPPALLLARQRLAAAQAAWDKADDEQDYGTGDPISYAIELELQKARGEVLILEREALGR